MPGYEGDVSRIDWAKSVKIREIACGGSSSEPLLGCGIYFL